MRLLHNMLLILITENICTVTMHFCHRGLSSGDSFQLGEKGERKLYAESVGVIREYRCNG